MDLRQRTRGRHHPLAVCALALSLLGAAGSAQASELDEIKETQKKILERLDAQDKVLKDIVQKLDARPQASGRAQIDPNKIYAIPVGTSPIRGPKAAKVTMVEFSDYECPYCAQSTGLVDQMMAAYPKDLQFVYKQMPLVQIHKNAMNGSKAVVAAGKQGKYWEMHDELFKISRNLTIDEIRKAAQKQGLDLTRFELDMSSPETEKVIQEDMAVARATDVTGTPAFFINGKRVMNRSFDAMKAMVDEELKKGVKP